MAAASDSSSSAASAVMAAKLMLLCFGWNPCSAAASAGGPAVATAGLLMAGGRVWELPTGAVSLGELFHGLSDRWNGRCLVGLRRAGDLEADRPEIGATAEPPMGADLLVKEDCTSRACSSGKRCTIMSSRDWLTSSGVPTSGPSHS
ncbi:MAG: hypothetical protein FRX49_02918 [Trebouxia sp. A1-2]|nr:MAG: hypothetical protein FRX49_02918 [Trebouxia sp. A1-2]